MKAIAAMASNRVIGKDGKLPWRIPGDLKFFKKMTYDKTCFVGRKTFIDLPYLQRRQFLIASNDVTYSFESSPNFQCIKSVCRNFSYPPILVDSDTMLIGGASLYKQMIPFCSDLYLTRLFDAYEGDTFFPSFEHQFKQWDVLERTDEYAIVHYKNTTPQ